MNDVGLDLLVRQSINALTLGGVYALIAVGYTMVYGIIKLINFAHGEIYMLGAFFGVTSIAAGLPFGVALVIAMAACALIGVLIDKVAYLPLRTAPRLAPLITAIGMSIFLQNLAMLVWGSEQRPFPELRPEYRVVVEGLAPVDLRAAWPAYEEALRAAPGAGATLEEVRPSPDGRSAEVRFRRGTSTRTARAILVRGRETLAARSGSKVLVREDKQLHTFERPAFHLGRVAVTWKVIMILVITAAMMICLEFIVMRTRIGKAMRACAQDKTTAALMGVDVNQVISITFAIGSAMAAVAGVLYGLYLGSGIYFRMGYYAGVVAFAAAVLGGIGNIRGAMLGGVLLGVAQVFAKAYLTRWLSIDSSYDIAFAFLILITVILVRPRGLLGSPSVERA